MPTTIISTDVTTTQLPTTNDPFVVTRDGSIINGTGAAIGGAGATTIYNTDITIHGEVVSGDDAISVGSIDGTTSGFGGHQIIISDTGSVSSVDNGDNAIAVRGSGNEILNDGSLYSFSATVAVQGAGGTVTNTGTIVSATNYGISFTAPAPGGVSRVVNSGTIIGEAGAVRSSQGDLRVVNSGLLDGANANAVLISSDGGDLNLTNYGTITTLGPNAVRTEDGDDVVFNYGSILGDVNLEAGMNEFTNAGDLTGDYIGGADDEIVFNTGLITGDVNLGTVDLGSGEDSYLGSGDGLVLGTVFLGDGDDTATLGNLGGSVRGGTDDDTITGGAGVDTIYGDNDNDVLRGREGDDFIDGGTGNDTVRGGTGDDELFGGAGDDLIRGGDGEDEITGGTGLDILFGGTGADTFIYLDATDSPDDNTMRDIIQDFTPGEDIIDLSAFAGLTYIGNSGFSGTGPEFSVSTPNIIDRVKIFIDLDGDGTADMKIVLNNTTALNEDDFLF